MNAEVSVLRNGFFCRILSHVHERTADIAILRRSFQSSKEVL